MDNTCNIPQQLVSDLVQFIGLTLEKECLTPSAEKRRSDLYHSLQPFHVQENEDVEEEQYEDPSLVQECSQNSIHSKPEEIKITYSYNEIRKMKTKCGPVWRKEKGILRDGWRKYMAGLCGHMLILYCSERDLKPNVCLNIQGYVARPAPDTQKDPKKKSITFEIVCPGKRDYQFFARTIKDMEQWIASICQASIQDIDSRFLLPSNLNQRISSTTTTTTTDSETDNYDDVSSIMDSSSASIRFEEEYYDDVAELKISDSDSEVQSIQNQLPFPTRSVKSNVDEAEELYNDIDDSEQFNVVSPPLPVRIKIGIEETNQQNSKANVQPVGKRSPLPNRPSTQAVNNADEVEELYNDIDESEQFHATNPPLPTRNRIGVEESKQQNSKTNKILAGKRAPILPPVAVKHEEEEFYNDIEPTFETSYTKYGAEEEEEIYHDISEYQKFPLPSNPQPKVNNDKPPPLPARRPLPSIPKEESFEVEETYDDVGSANAEEYSGQSTPSVNAHSEVVQEEIYDDVATDETTTTIMNKSNDLSHESRQKNKILGAQNNVNSSRQQINIHEQNKKTSIEVKNKTKIAKQNEGDTDYMNTEQGMNKSFLQNKYMGGNTVNTTDKNKNINKPKNEASQKESPTHNKETNEVKNEIASVQKASVKDIADKMNQQKNTSFLYRHSISDSDGTFQNEEMGCENKPSFMKTTKNPTTNNIDIENNGENFQSALKKIQASLAVGNMPSNSHPLKQNLPAGKPTVPTTKPVLNHLRNKSNPPPTTKPQFSTSSESAKFTRSQPNSPQISRLPVTSSETSESTPTLKHSSSVSKFSSSDSSDFHSSNSKIKTSSEQSPHSTASKFQIKNQSVQIQDNSKKSVTTKIGKLSSNFFINSNKNQNTVSNRLNTSTPDSSSNSSRFPVNRLRNKPNGLPVSIPSIPAHSTSKPPNLPPRPHLK